MRRLRGSTTPDRAPAVAAQRARRAGDQLAAPAAQPRLELGQQVLGEVGGVDGEDHALDHLRGAPPRRAVGRRLDLRDRQPAERAVDDAPSPTRCRPGAARRPSATGGRSRAAARPRSPADSLWTDGSGQLETPNALLGPSEARCWPKVGAGALRPDTEPSQVKTCSSASSSGSSEASTPADGTCGRERGGQRAEHGAGQRRQRGVVHGDAVGVEHRARHREPQRALGREPLGQHGDHVAAGLDAGRERLDEHVLLGGGRLEHRVDAPLLAHEALGLEAEREDHRRPRRRRSDPMPVPPG